MTILGAHQHIQKFRATTSSRTISISTRTDPNTQQHIILWEDIQQVFTNAQYILNAGKTVPFEADRDLKYILPLRIKHYPETVLEVAVPSTGKLIDSLRGFMDSTDVENDTRERVHSYHDLSCSYFHAIMSGQAMYAKGIKNDMDEHFARLQLELDRDRAFNDQFLQLQQQTLVRLAAMHNSMQTVITQTYELHEYPIPRLFIVLPKPVKGLSRLRKPFTNLFRLYFLCECGTHTKSDGSKGQHEIHLAKHEGYDLHRPTEFFEKYGPYVLTMMQMVKFGVSVAGCVVPPLASLRLLEGIDAIQQHIKLATDNIGPLVDDMIAYIQKCNEGNINTPTYQTERDKSEVLEGADLRQLQSYLNSNDKGRVLGNLYRIVTTEGHVKWVCIDHYRENYREMEIQQLRTAVESNRGIFVEENGKVEVKITSAALARQFYGAMVKAHRIHELEITLEWHVSMHDLQTLADAVTKSNIVHLTINGLYFANSKRDFINSGHRFEPIVQLMSNGRIQSLCLNNFSDFHRRVGGSALQMAPQLRFLSLGKGFSPNDNDAKVFFAKILKQCPGLNNLQLQAEEYSLLDLAIEGINGLSKLKSVTLDCTQTSVAVTLSKGKVKDTTVTIAQLVGLSRLDLIYIERGCLTTLKLQQTPEGSADDRLASILFLNPRLAEIHVNCHAERSAAIAKLIISKRHDILGCGRPCGLRKLELLSDDWQHGRELDVVTAVVNFPTSNAAPVMSFNIEMRELTPRNELNPILELLKQYGRSIKQFDTNSTFTDNLARSLYDSTSIEGSQLTTLILNPKSLTSVGLELMGKIIGLSQNLESLQFFIDRLEIENEQQRVQRGLDRHWESWNGLALRRDGSDRPLSQLLLDFPSRRQLPQLHTLRLSCSVKQPVPQACANWVVAMISVPISLSMPLSSLGSSPQHTRNTYSHTNPQSWKPLKCIDLEGFQFEPKDWRAIIESMDFSELETLSLADSNFSVEQFGILVECVFSCSASEVPLMCVKMGSTAVFYESDVVKVLSLFTRLQEKVPLVHIDGLWQLFSQDENSHGV